ncbi:LacI family DNA-binding transcriptional regulator [Isoptericola croceus]|uniref:LacI family DNA-binding transcriptional regulator n=1 Tax=Isoptericola croceus TaxID=3031406 RepID=UPI0023F6EC1F|nr:LacI family DNA-binding transcriptional regulator [Isoptericola croceus]
MTGTRPARRKRATIVEVAQLAGVSHQTVSRYLRTDGGMREGTRERVRAAIEELDYRPNMIARAMRDRRTGRLALVFPPGTAISSLEVLAGATRAAEEIGYVVEVVTLGGPPETRHMRVLELADCGLFEGIVSLTPLPDVERRAATLSTPVVVYPQYDEAMRAIGELAEASLVADIVDGLAERGHRRFLHAAGDYHHASARHRRDVYLETIERRGLESFGVLETDWSPQRACRGILDLPADCGVTAVVAASDWVAAGVVRGAVERGWRVPEDLSVTGWDNSPVGSVMPPGLTSVDVESERVGRRAIRQLAAALGIEPPAPEDDGPLNRIVWRGSTGLAPGA